MSAGPSYGTFAHHEARLLWRDASTMLTAGRTYRMPFVAIVLAGLYAGVHPLVDHMLAPYLADGLRADVPTLLAVSGLLAMLFSLMASQAIESVTRVYFGRSDFDLILSSPAPVERLFAVRAVVIAGQTSMLATLIASPVLNVVAWRSGAHHLLAYPLVLALALLAVGVALALSLLLLRTIGPRKARLVAQIVAAFVGAGFVIALQAFAIMGGSGLDRFAFFLSPDVLAAAPSVDAIVWWPAFAALGDAGTVLACVAATTLVFAVAVRLCSARFATDALAASGSDVSLGRRDRFAGFSHAAGVRAALRAKEWRLLKRDPWLVSQSLQQVLYMLPPALLLFVSYGEDRTVLFVVVPVLVMAAGQLAGGLAWLAISGEDARELIVTAPVPGRDVLIAKIQAVAGIVAWIAVPLSLALLPFSAKAALCALLGMGAAASLATLIQLWFRAQANRSFFRRRQVSSRAATLCEAMVSINCAAFACIVMAELPPLLLWGPTVALGLTLGVARLLRPAQVD